MRLLDIIYEMSDEIYLSDFQVPEKLFRNMKLINSIADDAYSVEEWQYVYTYIVKAPSYCTTVREIKAKLAEYATSNMDLCHYRGKKWGIKGMKKKCINKKDLVDCISKNTGVDEREVELIIDEFLCVVGDKMAAQEKVKLAGFGTFEARLAKGRKCHNPKTGEKTTVSEYLSPKFKAGKCLKDKIK